VKIPVRDLPKKVPKLEEVKALVEDPLPVAMVSRSLEAMVANSLKENPKDKAPNPQ
jgi:hypothetical protein